MTKQRDWPNAMREIRDQAADVAMDGIRALAPLVDGERVDRTEMIRRESQALRALERIAWLLQRAGAPIRPEDLR